MAKHGNGFYGPTVEESPLKGFLSDLILFAFFIRIFVLARSLGTNQKKSPARRFFSPASEVCITVFDRYVFFCGGPVRMEKDSVI